MRSIEDLKNLNARQLRQIFRSGEYDGATLGLPAVGKTIVQANLAFIPKEFGDTFAEFCERNKQACPLFEVVPCGTSEPKCTPGANVFTDAPKYCQYREGDLIATPLVIPEDLREKFVTFLIGCSFTAEEAVQRALSAETGETFLFPHIAQGKNVAMYRTSKRLVQVGKFGGFLVVSARWVPSRLLQKTIEVMESYPIAHGSPVQIGNPEALGIKDIAKPQWGEFTPPMNADDVLVINACGVSSSEAVRNARLAYSASHSPGSMFLTDVEAESTRIAV